MSAFVEHIQDALEECADACGNSFTIAGKLVAGDFTGSVIEEELERDGQKLKVRGTFVVSRRKLPENPQIDSIITDAAATRYRIGSIAEDDAAWTLTLTHPNGSK